MFTKEYWRSSAQKLKDVKYLALIASFIALKVIAGSIYIPVAENLRIGIGFIIVAIEAAIIGPVAGIVSGAITDLVAFALFPSGPFFIGYTLTAMLGSFVYAIFLYRTQISVLRIIGAKIINNYIVNVVIGSLWSAMLYGNAYMVYVARSIVKNTLLLPIEVIILVIVFNLLIPFLQKRKFIISQKKHPLPIK